MFIESVKFVLRFLAQSARTMMPQVREWNLAFTLFEESKAGWVEATGSIIVDSNGFWKTVAVIPEDCSLVLPASQLQSPWPMRLFKLLAGRVEPLSTSHQALSEPLNNESDIQSEV